MATNLFNKKPIIPNTGALGIMPTNPAGLSYSTPTNYTTTPATLLGGSGYAQRTMNPFTSSPDSYAEALRGGVGVSKPTSVATSKPTSYGGSTPYSTPISNIPTNTPPANMGTDFKGSAGNGYNTAYKGPSGDTVYVKDPSQAPAGYNPVQSTDSIRKDEVQNKQKASSILNQQQSFDEYTTMIMRQLGINPEGVYSQEDQKLKMDEMEAMRKSMGVFTPEEEARFQAAGQDAYDRYLPIINEAQESQRMGMPKAVISGGERGGFMNTQIAGVAALMPNQGGDFTGFGGELKNISNIYDRNIQQAKNAAESARFQAIEAARQAAITGEAQDMQYAEAAYNRMVQANKDAIAMASDKVNAISNYQTMAQARITFGQGQEDRSLATILPAIAPLLTGDNEKDMVVVNEFAEKYGIDPNYLIGALNEYGTGGEGWKAVSPGSAIVDNAGNIIGMVPEPTDTSKPETQTFNGMVHQWNPETQSWTSLGTAGTDKTGSPESIAEAQETKNEMLRLATQLKSLPGLKLATGASSVMSNIPGTEAYNVKRTFDQLRDMIAFGNIDKMKGAMSDKDIVFLRNMGTKLDLGLSTDEFIKELDTIIQKASAPYQAQAVQSTGGDFSW